MKLIIAYDGSAFHGWQAQEGVLSVQALLSSELSRLLGRETQAYASGRTDAGVHALGQCCHFDTSSKIAPEKFAVILNTKLPKTVRVLSSEAAPEGFHARFSTMSREYWYLVKRTSDMLPFDYGHVTPWNGALELDRLEEYAQCIRGTHDFTTFASARDPSPSHMRDMYISSWDVEKDKWGFDVFRYRVAGNAFLYHQVRSMTGTMLSCLEAGEGKEEFSARLEARSRAKALRTAAPDGLYLAQVSYDSEKYQWFEEEYAR